MTYTIKIRQFEGPFDLLLFFIERDELDINDIPIAKITDDFLSYIRELESLNLDVASEFILVAATLMKVKSRMLIPRKQVDEEGNEIDPRAELVQRLMEYKKYKSVLEELRKMEEEQGARVSRGNTRHELRQLAEKALVDVELESLSLYKMLKAFEQVMEEFRERKLVVHTIARYDYTIQDQTTYIVKMVKPNQKLHFEDLFRPLENRIHAIVTFLALLEMINEQRIMIVAGEGINNFWLSIPDEKPLMEEE